jgi:hypothetical protein
VNEIELIRRQLVHELQHVSEVAALCATESKRDGTKGSEHGPACLDYLAWASSRFKSTTGVEVLAQLETLRGTAPTEAQWREFLQLFQRHWQTRVAAVNDLLERNPLVTEWRSVGRVDADSVLEERERYGRVRATRPSSISPP